ncbi:MAG: porin [Corticimicrobacter sp.]|uniref:porin n=1 Tax=Corticimicrobacter sp. TaxID=2678536 RepID=UPI0032DA9834
MKHSFATTAVPACVRLLPLTALCAALLPLGAAHAEAPSSSVTLYGVIDTGLAYTRISNFEGQGRARKSGLISGGQADSLWGLRGAEDLGDGLSATFTLESGFDANSGNAEEEGRLFNYAAWLGLNHADYGELRFGRQNTVAQQAASGVELAGWKDFGLGATFKAADNYQLSNTINYFSPDFGGLKLGLGYSFNADESSDFDSARQARELSAALSYEDGPLYVALTYDRLQPKDSGSVGLNQPDAWQLGASYDFGPVKLAGGWSRQKNGFVGLNGDEYANANPDRPGLGGLGPNEFVDGGRLQSWYAGATIPLGGGDLTLQWSLASPDWDWQGSGDKAKNIQVYTIGYSYSLSPRTSVYAFAGRMKNASTEVLLTPDNPTTTRVAVGLTHAF